MFSCPGSCGTGENNRAVLGALMHAWPLVRAVFEVPTVVELAPGGRVAVRVCWWGDNGRIRLFSALKAKRYFRR
jgi:hypothetical protein